MTITKLSKEGYFLPRPVGSLLFLEMKFGTTVNRHIVYNEAHASDGKSSAI